MVDKKSALNFNLWRLTETDSHFGHAIDVGINLHKFNYYLANIINRPLNAF